MEEQKAFKEAEPVKNPLETEKISKLLASFCIPSLASSLVTSVYNIVDQLFIGNTLGIVGNAATNVVFPVVTLITALSLMCGVGPSASMNINLGHNDKNAAARAVGGGFGLMVLCGLIVAVPMLIFTEPILHVFGCTDTVMPYAMPYARIISLGFVFSMIGASGPFLIRADNSPNYALLCIATGAALNIILDAIFIYGFKWGIRGAAWATVDAQFVNFLMVIRYMRKSFGVIKLKASDFKPDFRLYGKMAAIGAGPAFNFLTQALVQVFLNNALRTYGAASKYGSDICLAAAGVANKVNSLAVAMVVGMTNGLQPIASYNFGRKNYARVAEAARAVVKIVLICGCVIFACYQLFPIQITSLFGSGSDLYFEFTGKFFRIFYLLIALFGLQTSVAGFFSAQGKVSKSVTISLVRQVLFFPPLLVILPKFMGLNGVLWSGPISDLAMAVVASVLFTKELRKLDELQKHENTGHETEAAE
ncbi:MAG: MATE family efflux transporter [Eubacteriales bacterium]|nr:MATE family efflux transporter [Eubacteriales bacterium]